MEDVNIFIKFSFKIPLLKFVYSQNCFIAIIILFVCCMISKSLCNAVKAKIFAFITIKDSCKIEDSAQREREREEKDGRDKKRCNPNDTCN